MKYTAQITITQNGEPGALKGEDLDQEMEDLIQQCEPDGWEIASVNLSRAEISKSRMADNREMVTRIFDALVRECGDLSQPARINAEYTKAEICEFWRDDIKKLLA
jgi:hypothetical protein